MASSTVETITATVYITSTTLAAAPEATTSSVHDGIGLGPTTPATKTIAIVLPSLFSIILLILVAIAFLLPRMAHVESPVLREERRRRRMARLNKDVKAQAYKEWFSTLKGPSTSWTSQSPICVICLEGIDDAANVRGLGCLHVFHQECLDDWFSRFNNFCPLCHRPILRAMAKEEALDGQDRRRSILPALMV